MCIRDSKGTNGWEVDARLKDAMKERGVDCDYITYIDKQMCIRDSYCLMKVKAERDELYEELMKKHFYGRSDYIPASDKTEHLKVCG